MSLARRHRAKALGLQAAKAEPGARPGPAASEYQLLLARMGVDLRRLKEIQSIERKIELKRELLPAYLAMARRTAQRAHAATQLDAAQLDAVLAVLA